MTQQTNESQEHKHAARPFDPRWLTLSLLLVTATYALAEDITLTANLSGEEIVDLNMTRE